MPRVPISPLMITAPLTELSQALAKGRLSSIELVEGLLARIDRANHRLNAFLTIDRERALGAARAADARRARGEAGPLAGLPIAHKDVLMTAGLKTTCGSRMLENFVAPYSAFVVEQLAAAGMVLVGKTNMDEFAMGSSNGEFLFRPGQESVARRLRGRRQLGRLGGGGRARLTPAATGTDTGGSIRQPAALSGVCGIKPTYGVCSRYGLIAFASSLDTPGVFGQTAADCAMLLTAMAGHDARDSTSLDRPREDYSRDIDAVTPGLPLAGLRLGLPREYAEEGTDAAVTRAIETALGEFRRLGAVTVDVSLPNVHLAVPVYYVIAPAGEASSNLSRFDGVRYGHRAASYDDLDDMYRKTRAEGFGPEVKRRILVGTYVLSHGYYDAYYLKAQQVRRLIVDDFRRAYESCDLIVGPTSPTAAFRIGEKSDDPVKMYLNDIFTIAGNLTAHRQCRFPAASTTPACRSASRSRAITSPKRKSSTPRIAIKRSPAGIAASRRSSRHEREGPPRARISPAARSAEGSPMTWEVVIGLETHAQLSTATKIFSGASTTFGAAPNTQAAAVDIALPGVLPVLNRGAVDRAIRFGLAIGADINAEQRVRAQELLLPRPAEGLPDQPVRDTGRARRVDRAFVSADGGEVYEDGALTRAHLEEDAGKSLHEDFHGMTGIDLNRAGTPLLEIVSEPDMRSAAEAVAYAKALQRWCAGSASATATCRKAGSAATPTSRCASRARPLGTRCEIKNLNSFRFMQQAIEFEVRRQIDLIEDGGTIVQETRLYDPDRGETRSMRSKEDAQDYRYFPDPDLLPLEIDEAWVARIRADMPELPESMAHRFVAEYAIALPEALQLTASRETARYFEETMQASVGVPLIGKTVANWILGEVSAD